MIINWVSKKEAAMKSNFEFLKEYWSALAQIGETAKVFTGRIITQADDGTYLVLQIPYC